MLQQEMANTLLEFIIRRKTMSQERSSYLSNCTGLGYVFNHLSAPYFHYGCMQKVQRG